ncbi:hypothetical protein CRUP_034441 [Coryphaenoides rupestris]|nr:hypothetical protein CRUP_034441 [Coryphaenoides rupestris]
MAFVEAAQAMVQYYQLTPAMINEQKLLIRMSKRYKELQLKKPGKDVDSIIYDINTQRVRGEMQEPDHYMPERARSRSPISRSLSPRSHSPSFTSCSSAHSPQGGPCRGGPTERGAATNNNNNNNNNTNGLGPGCRGSWDWTCHPQRGGGPMRGAEEEQRERERDELLWRNGTVGGGGGGVADEDRCGGGGGDRRTSEEEEVEVGAGGGGGCGGGGGGGDGMRGSRDWYHRGSPHGMSFNSYRRSPEGEFYSQDQMYKAEKPPRAPYARHEGKPKRRDYHGGMGEGDYHGRSRHFESDMAESELRSRTPEDRKQQQSSPGRGRNKKTSRRHGAKEKQESQSTTGNTAGNTTGDMTGNNVVEAYESGEDTEGECWYPGNMEELVTVDEVEREVGGEDDSIMEPDLQELLEAGSCSSSKAEPEPAREVPPPAWPWLHAEMTEEELPEACPPVGMVAVVVAAAVGPADTEAPVLPITDLNDFPGQEFRAALEEVCSEDKADNNSRGPSEGKLTASMSEDSMVQDVAPPPETNIKEIQHQEGTPKTGVHNVTNNLCPMLIEVEDHSPMREQERAISEHSIPLGVEFVVPRTGYFCKLCGLFYTSEETAKISHCRSTVHYRNLQKYLSQLAEESLLGALTWQPSSE